MDLLVLLLFPAAWLGLGGWTARRLGLADELLGPGLLGLTLGAAIHSLVISVALLVGVSALPGTLVVLAAGAAGLAITRPNPRDLTCTVRDWWNRSNIVDRLLAGACALYLLFLLLGSFAPPHSYDALCYHLPEVRHYFETASLTPMPEVKETYYPKAIEALFVSAKSLGTYASCQVAHALLGLILVGCVGRMGTRLLGFRGGLVAVFAFLAIRDTSYVFGTADVDLGFALFQVVAVSQATQAIRTGSLRAASAAGALAGMGVAAKLLGAGLVGIASLLLFAGRWWRGRALGSALACATLCGVLALAVYSPWFARNHFSLGEWLFPLRPARIVSPVGELGGEGGARGETVEGRLESVGRGYEIRGRSILTSLYALTFEQRKYKHPLNPGILAFAPLGLLCLLAGWPGRGGAGWIALFGLALYVFWFKTYPNIRYGLAGFALLAIAAGAGWVFLCRGGWWVRIVATGVLALFLGAGLAKNAHEAWYSVAHGVLGPREEYLAARQDTYPFLEKVRERTSGRVLSSDDRIFYLGPRAVPISFRNAFWSYHMDGGAFFEWLRGMEIEHVAFAKSRSLWRKMGPTCEELARNGRLKVVFECDDGTLYDVVPEKPGGD